MEVIEFLKKIGAWITTTELFNQTTQYALWFDTPKAEEFSEYFKEITDVFDCQLIGGSLSINFTIDDSYELFGESLTEEELSEFFLHKK